MPLQATSGAASYDAFGGGVPVVPNYIEEVFQTWLFDGTSATQTITNGIDLSTKGGLVWIKNRNGTYFNTLFDTVRGTSKALYSNTTDAETGTSGVTAFNTTGFTLGAGANTNAAGYTYVSWTFREQPKFFDVVTYTGNGASSQAISHSLGSVPGCVIFKKTNNVEDWTVWHRSLSTDQYLILNSTSAVQTLTGLGPAAGALTSTTITVPEYLNSGSQPFVAYLFAHDAGGFGLTGTDNVISCGSVSATGSVLTAVNLGWEPQWVLIKRSNGLNGWSIVDNMRKFTANNGISYLSANTSSAEASTTTLPGLYLTSTGFSLDSDQSPLNGTGTYIYIAIRRGPMKVPTSGTSVFAPLTYTGNGTSGRYISGAGFPPDLIIQTARSASENREFDDRLRGGGSTAMNALFSNSTNAEAADSGSVQLLNQDGFTVRSFGNGSSVTYIGECFRRAPSFFDEVCYTGTGVSNQAFTHNLGAVPELMIIKMRVFSSGTGFWFVYSSTLGYANYLLLNATDASAAAGIFGSQNPDSSSFYVSAGANINSTASQYVAYLFATCAGVSKVGSYTGTGTTLQINCGFTAGARFVLIKRTDSTGSWYVWDSSRGIVSGNDPYLLLNSTAAEVTNTDYIDTYSAGFEISSTAPAEINASGGSFIFLAIS